MGDLEKTDGVDVIINKKSGLDKTKKKIINKFNIIINYSKSIFQGDSSKLNQILDTFNLYGWKYSAEKIDTYSKPVKKSSIDFAILIGSDMPYQLTDRQRKKAIIVLLGQILIYYARQRNNSVGAMDTDIGYVDIIDCINHFSIDEEIFCQSVIFAREYYKKYFNENIPNGEMKLEDFTK